MDSWQGNKERSHQPILHFKDTLLLFKYHHETSDTQAENNEVNTATGKHRFYEFLKQTHN